MSHLLPAQERRDSVAVVVLPGLSIVGSVAALSGVRVGSGVPARISIVSDAELKDRKARVFGDLVAAVPSLTVYDDLGSPHKLNIVSRGFVSSPVVGLPQGLSVFLDGVRVNEPEAAQVNYDLLPLEHLDRIEVLSGTGTLLGRNSLGGAVNLVTARGAGAVRGVLQVERGSFGAHRATGSLAGGTQNGWEYYAGADGLRERGWRQATSARQHHLLFNGGRTSLMRGIRLLGLHARSHARTAGSLPESVFDVRPDSNLSADDYENLGQYHFAINGWAPAAGGQVNASLFLRRHHAERFNRNQPADPDVFARSRNTSLGATAEWRTAVSVGATRAGLRAGVDGALTDVQINIHRDSVKLGGTREISTRVGSPGHDMAVFAMGDVTRVRVMIAGGLRLDRVRSPYENRLEPALDTVNTFTRLSGRFGVSVNPGRGMSLYASVGQAFRAPATLELACSNPERPCPLPFALGDDPPLAPVLVNQVEVGGRWVAGRAMASGSLFHSDVFNDIYLLATETEVTGSSIDGYFANIGRTRRQGLEVDARLFLARAASLYASWTWTRATFQTSGEIFSLRTDEDNGITNSVHPGRRLPLVPDHVMKGGASVPVTTALTLSADVRYLGRRYLRGDEANNTPPLSPHSVLDARVRWVRRRWELSVIGQNVLARRYASFGGYNVNQGHPSGPTLERFLTPGEPRRVAVVVRWGSRHVPST